MEYRFILKIVAFSFLLFSCSRIDWYRDYNECIPCESENGVFVCQCDSGSFSMYFSWTQSFRMVGLPYIPLFPIPIGDSHSIYVFVTPKYDSLHYSSHPPEFALRPINSNELIKYEWADTNKNRGNKIYHYRYNFDISGYSPDTIEVVFTKDYFGCTLPPITFIASKRTEYEPIEFPAN